jgi:hypothetical protein
MRTQLFLSLVAVAAIAGCGKGGSHTGDGGAPVDMADVPPVPVATAVGTPGNTCCIASDAVATHVAYLLNAAVLKQKLETYSIPLGTAGELHVAGSDGTDVKVAANIFQGNYLISPDGKSIFYAGFDPATAITTGDTTFNRFDVATGTSTQLADNAFASSFLGQLPDGTPVFAPTPFAANTFFTPSGKYLLLGVLAPMAQSIGDLWVIDVDTGTAVIKRGAGEWADLQFVTGDDTLIFEDTVGGTVTGTNPPTDPLQTLYWQPISSTSTAAVITTRASQFTTTGDGGTLIILRTNGDIVAFDLTKHTLGAAPIATGAITFTLGSGSKGPLAYIGADQSVHVIDTTGAKQLDLDAATAKAALNSTVVISPDNAHLYFWQNFEVQATRGTLMHVAIKSGSTPNKIADLVSSQDLRITDSALVYLQNVDQPGQLGDAMTSGLDGSSAIALGTKANVGGLQLVNPVAKSWYAVHLTACVPDTTNTPIVGTALEGALSLGSAGATTETTLDTKVGASQYTFTDDGHDVIYVSQASWFPLVSNYVGTLQFVDLRSPTTPIVGGVVGVSELGPVSNRALFVNAPAANPAGVYHVKY